MERDGVWRPLANTLIFYLVKQKRKESRQMLARRVAQAALRQGPAASQLARRSVLNQAAQQQQRSYVVDPKRGNGGDFTLTRNKYQSVLKEEFPLELGGSLPEVTIEWEQWGDCSLPGDRTILVLPSFSHSSHAASNRDDPQHDRPGKAINTSYFRVICPSVLGSPFGATSPLTVNPLTGEKYKASFPQLTPADMARCHAKILDDLGIDSVHTVIGASMGGIQALEFAAQFPDRLDRLVGLACTHQTTPGTVAFRRVQRLQGGNYTPSVPLEGMKVALSWEFDARFDWNPTGPMHFKTATFEVESYMDYQANKFARLYDPNCYLLLSKAMDLTNLGRNALNLAGYEPHLVRHPGHRHQQDLLIPIQEQRNLVNILQSYGHNAQLVEVDSKFGHDSMFNSQMQRDVFSPLVREYVEEQLANILPHEQHRYSSL
ncbi:Alpha/Beta hydrolase fold [Phytophthora cactorum]|nr:Alpha/Beta hydrolase fold [Phytophthora cactorum]